MTSIVSWIFGAASAPYGNPLDDRYYEGLAAGAMSAAGQRISPETAVRVGAVYRCASILANVLAMFPKGMYERIPNGRQEAENHPLDPIISFRPNQRQSAFEFWRLLFYHLVLRQNAFAQIVPGIGGVGELIPLHPDRIKGPTETPSGLLRYEYTRPDNTRVPLIGGVDVWHLTGLSSDGLRGMSLTDLAADTIGVSMAAEKHAARFYQRGVKATGVLEHPRTLTKDTAEAMSDSFGRKYGGEPGQGRVPVLWEGMKFTPISLNLKDQEFLDSRKFTVAEIARWFGVPPHMVGDVERSTSWGTGIEQQGLHFLIYSLLPWIELVEQSIRFALVYQPERFYPKFNVNAILRMDAKTQAEVFQILVQNGVLSANECRDMLDRNPRDGGDEYMTPHVGTQPPLPPKPPASESSPADAGGPAAMKALTALAERLAAGRSQGGARARAIARWAAGQILEREAAELGELAQKAGANQSKWQHSVASFYGRHATYVAEALSISPDEARAYCKEQQDAVSSPGGCPASSQKWTEAHMGRLVELAAKEQAA